VGQHLVRRYIPRHQAQPLQRFRPGRHSVEDPHTLGALERRRREPFSQRWVRELLKANEQASIRLTKRARPNEVRMAD
jgi:hypothetical protein